jgi:hypothetical protein
MRIASASASPTPSATQVKLVEAEEEEEEARRSSPENEQTNERAEAAVPRGVCERQMTSNAGIAGVGLEGLRLGSAAANAVIRMRVQMRDNAKRWRREEREACEGSVTDEMIDRVILV